MSQRHTIMLVPVAAPVRHELVHEFLEAVTVEPFEDVDHLVDYHSSRHSGGFLASSRLSQILRASRLQNPQRVFIFLTPHSATSTRSQSPRIFIASLSDYVNGRLHGVWIEAPLDIPRTYRQIVEMLARSPFQSAEEWAIHDFEGSVEVRLREHNRLETVARIFAELRHLRGPVEPGASHVGPSHPTLWHRRGGSAGWSGAVAPPGIFAKGLDEVLVSEVRFPEAPLSGSWQRRSASQRVHR